MEGESLYMTDIVSFMMKGIKWYCKQRGKRMSRANAEWGNAERTILLHQLAQGYTIDELYQMLALSGELLAEVDHPVAVLWIIQGGFVPKGNILQNVRGITVDTPENVRVSAIVTGQRDIGSGFLEAIVRIVGKMTKNALPLPFFKTIDEGYSYALAELDKITDQQSIQSGCP
jgi:hypothetical protein